MPRRIATYPMVEEHDATGAVADTYRRILEQMPMVPSLLKSLAVFPPSVALAWQQADAILGTDTFTSAANDLVSRVASVVPPPGDRRVRDDLGRFVAPLARMLLLAAGLELALAGRLEGRPARRSEPTPGARSTPEWDVPATGDIPEVERFGDVRAALGTPIVNSIWRYAAASGTFPAAWEHLAPYARDAAVRRRADELGDEATRVAGGLEWPVVASPQAYAAADAADAVPGAAAIVAAYTITLPRVLVLVAGCRANDGD